MEKEMPLSNLNLVEQERRILPTIWKPGGWAWLGYVSCLWTELTLVRWWRELTGLELTCGTTRELTGLARRSGQHPLSSEHPPQLSLDPKGVDWQKDKKIKRRRRKEDKKRQKDKKEKKKQTKAPTEQWAKHPPELSLHPKGVNCCHLALLNFWESCKIR